MNNIYIALYIIHAAYIHEYAPTFITCKGCRKGVRGVWRHTFCGWEGEILHPKYVYSVYQPTNSPWGETKARRATLGYWTFFSANIENVNRQQLFNSVSRGPSRGDSGWRSVLASFFAFGMFWSLWCFSSFVSIWAI